MDVELPLILVVEDDATVSGILRRYLEREGLRRGLTGRMVVAGSLHAAIVATTSRCSSTPRSRSGPAAPSARSC